MRTIRDLDILLRRNDLPAAMEAIQDAGFACRHSPETDMFLAHHHTNTRDAVHVLLASERVRETDLFAAPDVEESVMVDAHRTLSLAALVRMKLNVFLRKDQLPLLHMLDVGLIEVKSSVPGVSVTDQPERRSASDSKNTDRMYAAPGWGGIFCPLLMSENPRQIPYCEKLSGKWTSWSMDCFSPWYGAELGSINLPRQLLNRIYLTR